MTSRFRINPLLIFVTFFLTPALTTSCKQEFKREVHYQYYADYMERQLPDFSTLGEPDAEGVLPDFSLTDMPGSEADHYAVLFTAKFDALKDFKDMEDSTFKNFMGEIVYTASFELDGKNLPKYINLGKVADICELKINGKDAGMKWFGDRVYDISTLVHGGRNTIEVKVTTLMGNYIQTLKDNRVAQRFVLRRNQPYVPAGLIGPIQLYR